MLSDDAACSNLLNYWNLDELEFISTYVKTDKGGQFIKLRHPTTLKRLKLPNGRFPFVNDIKRTKAEHGDQFQLKCTIAKGELREQWNAEYALTPVTVTPLARARSAGAKPTENESNSVPQQIEANRLFVNRLYTELCGSERLAGIVGRVIPTFGADMNKQELSFLFEIIQNANDYPQGKKPVHLDISIDDTKMVIEHNGTPFEAHHVDSLCNVLKTTKEEGEDKIGYKGIGFKSIFSISDHVHVQSGGFSFRFDKSHHENPEEFPWQIAPIWTTPTLQIQDLTNVHIACRLKRGREFSESVLKKLETHDFDESSILFLPNIEKVGIHLLDREFQFRKGGNSTSRWTFHESTSILIPEDIKEQLRKSDVVPDKLKNSGSTFLQFATRTASEESVAGKIFVFLPTRLETGLPFHINGNFIPDVSRHELNEDLEWNSFLIKQAGIHLIHWLANHANSKGAPPDLLGLTPIRDRVKMGFWEDSFIEGITEGLHEIPIVPCTDGNTHNINEVCLDCIGISELIGESLLKAVFKMECPIALSNEGVKSGIKRLVEFLDHGKGPRLIEWADIEEGWHDERLKAWLCESNHCRRTIEFLQKENRLNSDHCIIPNAQGEFRSVTSTCTGFYGGSVLAYCLDIHIPKDGIFNGDESEFNLTAFSARDYIDEVLNDSNRIKAIESRFKEHDNPNGLLHYLHCNKENLSDSHYQLIHKGCGIMDDPGLWHTCIAQAECAFLFNPFLKPISAEPENFGFTLIGEFRTPGDQDDEKASWLAFLNKAKVNKMDAQRFHTKWLAPLIEDTSPAKHPWRSQKLQNMVWSFLFESWKNLDDEAQSSLVKLTKETTVLSSEGTLQKLKHCSPMGDAEIGRLVEAFHLDHHFLSNGYPPNLQSGIKELGAKGSARGIVKPMLAKLKEMDDEAHVNAMRFLFQFKGHKAISKYSDTVGFDLVTETGGRKPIKDCLIIPDEETPHTADGLAYPSRNLIKKDLFRDESINEWMEFLEEIGVDQTASNTTRIRIEGWVFNENATPSIPADRSRVWQRLAELHCEKKLSPEAIKALGHLKLHVIDTKGQPSMQLAEDCLFGSNATRWFDLQTLMKDKDAEDYWFLHETVPVSDSAQNLLLEIGVQPLLEMTSHQEGKTIFASKLGNFYRDALFERFPEIRFNRDFHHQHRVTLGKRLPGIKFLEDPDVSQAFWEQAKTVNNILPNLVDRVDYQYYFYQGNHKTQQVPSDLLIRLRTMNCIPVTAGANVSPKQIAAPHLQHLLPEYSRSSIDLKVKIGGEPLWKILNCKQTLSIEECLAAIPLEKWKPYGGKQPELAKQLSRIVAEGDSEILKSKIEEYTSEALWPNAHGELKRPEQLAVFGPGMTATSHHRAIMLHASLKDIAGNLGIRTLKKEEMLTKPEQPGEQKVKALLLERLDDLAEVANSANPEERATNWKEKLKPLSFIGVDCIHQSIENLNFSSSHLQEYSEGDVFYYLRPHTGLNALELVSKLMGLLELQDEELWALKDVLAVQSSEWDAWLVRHGLKENPAVSPIIQEPTTRPEPDPEVPHSEELEEIKQLAETPQTTPNQSKPDWLDGLKEDQRERLEGLLGIDIPREQQALARIEALFRGVEHIEDLGWELDETEDAFARAIHDQHPLAFINSSGELLKVFCRSAKGGILWLGSHPWKMLGSESDPHELFVIRGSEEEEFEHFKSRSDLIEHHTRNLGYQATLAKISDYNFDETKVGQTWNLEREAQKLMPGEVDGGSQNLHFIFVIKSNTKLAESMIGLFKTNRKDEFPTP